jgi:drug/metabolite transporter (DMT)-like permease
MGQDKKKKRLAFAALIAMTFIWGTSFVILKNTLESISTLYILAVRFTGAALIMAVFGAREWRKADRKYLIGGALMGACMFVAYVFQTYGLVYTTPGKNAFLTTTYCVIVPFLYWLIRGRKPDGWNIAAAVLCVIGVGLISLDAKLSVNKGDILTVICGLFYALHIIVSAAYVRGRSVILLTAVQFGTAAVLSWISAVMFAPAPSGAPASAWLSVAYLCIMCTAVCFGLQAFGQKYSPPSQTAVIMTLESVFGAAISVVFFNEKLTLKIFLGFAAMFIAVLISETKLSFLRRGRQDAE